MSHSRLVAFIHQHRGSGPLTRVYLKTQLIALCQGYGLRVFSQLTKTVIGEALLNAIAENNCIPFSVQVDDRQFRIVKNSNSDGHIRIHLSRGIQIMYFIINYHQYFNIRQQLIFSQSNFNPLISSSILWEMRILNLVLYLEQKIHLSFHSR